MTLGMTAMRTLVVSSATGVFGSSDDLPPGFWEHSVAVAAAAAMAGRLCGVARGDTICAGLLHDLGAPLLFRYDRPGYEMLIESGAADAHRFLDDETRLYGAHHAAVSADALAAWKLPASMVSALRTHHDQPDTVTEKLGRVLIAGEALADAAFESSTFAHEPAHDPAKVFDVLGLRVASIDTLVARASEETQALTQMLTTQ